MKLKLNKKNIKNLSLDSQVLPSDMTPDVAGAGLTFNTAACLSKNLCGGTTVDSRPHCSPGEDTVRGVGC